MKHKVNSFVPKKKHSGFIKAKSYFREKVAFFMAIF